MQGQPWIHGELAAVTMTSYGGKMRESHVPQRVDCPDGTLELEFGVGGRRGGEGGTAGGPAVTLGTCTTSPVGLATGAGLTQLRIHLPTAPSCGRGK